MATEYPTIKVIRSPATVPDNQRNSLLANPGFGKIFTDHMVTMKWQVTRGWHDAEVRAREAILLDPACAVLHYAQEIFEGMKAYRSSLGDVVLFRPDQNAQRFARSAERMAMPTMPADLFLDAVKAVVDIDRAWIPDGEGSLYLRPFMFASEAFLGVRPATEYLFCVIASPVGPYFKGGVKPITLWVTEDFSRAGPGGTGAAKCGGNYAAGLLAQAEAARHNCDQVVFLDAIEHCWIEELGGMNLFFVMRDGRIVTPPLGGTILPGITRSSIMTLAVDRRFAVDERRYSLAEWKQDAESGRLAEAFACGTAAVVAGIGEVRSNSGNFVIGGGDVGPVTAALRDELLSLQRGDIPDRHDWLVHVA